VAEDFDALRDAACALRDALPAAWMVGCAESCTGGLAAAAITALPGSSQWFERGVVSYSNRAKHELLGVDDALLQRYGAVSEEVARAMAAGLLRAAPVQATLAITGIAGPDGGSADKPVGLVWFGWACSSAQGPRIDAERRVFAGDRAAVRTAAARHALLGLARRVAQRDDVPAAR
jgi:nicotinamide-nucleotide amidase